MIYTMCTNNFYLYFSLINFSNRCFILNNAIIISFLDLLFKTIIWFQSDKFLCYKKKYRREKQNWGGNEKNGKKAKITISFNSSETSMNLELNVLLIPCSRPTSVLRWCCILTKQNRSCSSNLKEIIWVKMHPLVELRWNFHSYLLWFITGIFLAPLAQEPLA